MSLILLLGTLEFVSTITVQHSLNELLFDKFLLVSVVIDQGRHYK
jgi:hypothetical protein